MGPCKDCAYIADLLFVVFSMDCSTQVTVTGWIGKLVVFFLVLSLVVTFSIYLQTQKLSVHQRPLVKPNSAIGFLKNGKLHLCPLDSIVQMTPSFEHIDKK